jgi:hypothetical protein
MTKSPMLQNAIEPKAVMAIFIQFEGLKFWSVMSTTHVRTMQTAGSKKEPKVR